jgi:hypothetical protein
MRYVTLVNRTSKILNGTWDGRSYNIHPGKNSFPETMAGKFKDQNPIMGSQDPYSLELQYLCGIEEDGDDCSPIEQSDKIELMDRSRMRNAIPVVVIQGEGLYSRQRDGNAPAPSIDTKVNFSRD